jgi:hypothetical protein
MKSELIPEEIDTEVFLFHNTLHPDFWGDDNKLHADLRPKLLQIARAYLDYIKLPNGVKIEDISLTGSLAGYNYTKFSDLDIHIIIDYGSVCEPELMEHYAKAMRDLWAENHDVMVKGYEVELFTQDHEQFLSGPSAQYSLIKNKWIKEPQPGNRKLDKKSIERKAQKMMDDIEDMLHDEPSQELMDDIDTMRVRIKNMRQAGLDGEGEYSAENLIFKVLRNEGYIEKLMNLKNSTQDALLGIK